MKTFEEFLYQFHKIKEKGFIKSLRDGNTGAGYTLESELGLIENNLSLPDLIEFSTELKTKRITSKSSSLTLYTNDSAWVTPQIDVIEKYGWNHRKYIGEKTVQSTVTTRVNKRKFNLIVTDPKYLLVCKDDTPFIEWTWETISQDYFNKFGNLIVVDVDVKKVENKEWFHFIAFNRYQNTSTKHFRNAVENGLIDVDLRLYTQYNVGKGVRNRGTALRVKHKNVSKLYDSQEYYS